MWEAGDAGAATGLLRRALDDFEDAFEAPMVTELLGEIAAAQGELGRGREPLSGSLTRWADLDRTTGAAEVFLADVLSRRGTGTADDQALDLLDRYLGRDGVHWNNVLFLWHLVRLRIAERRGDKAAIAASAQTAIALAESGPQVPHHTDLGRVQTNDVTLPDYVVWQAVATSAHAALREMASEFNRASDPPILGLWVGNKSGGGVEQAVAAEHMAS